MIGPAAQVAKTELQNAILTVLRTEGKPMTQARIAKAAGRKSQSTISQAVRVMLREGLVEHCKEGYTAATSGNEFEGMPDAPFEKGGQ